MPKIVVSRLSEKNQLQENLPIFDFVLRACAGEGSAVRQGGTVRREVGSEDVLQMCSLCSAKHLRRLTRLLEYHLEV